MPFPLVLDHLVHRIPHLTDALLVEEVTHIDTETVNELTCEVLILHQTVEKLRGIGRYREVGTLMQVPVGRIIPLCYDLMISRSRRPWVAAVEPQSVVEVLGNPPPLAALSPRTPQHIVVARVIEVVEVHVHHGDPYILLPVHEFRIFRQRVTFLVNEIPKSQVVVIGTLLQLLVLYQVYVFQTVVVGDDIVLVGPFAYIQHTPVVAVDIHHSRTPCLPVNVCVLRHRTLTDGVAHIQTVTVVAGISQHY